MRNQLEWPKLMERHKYSIFGILGQEQENKLPFNFSLFVTEEEIGKIITGIITSNIGTPQNFSEEIRLRYGVDATHDDFLKLVENLSAKVLQRYPEGHQRNQDAVMFLGKIRSRL